MYVATTNICLLKMNIYSLCARKIIFFCGHSARHSVTNSYSYITPIPEKNFCQVNRASQRYDQDDEISKLHVSGVQKIFYIPTF